MKNKIVIVIIASLLLNCFCVYSQKLPSSAMGMPKIFLNEEMSWQWEEIAQKRDWGDLSNNPWKVYVDKEDVKAFDKPSASASVNQTCHFMDSYYVAKIKNGYALLFTQDVPSLNISSKAKACGWVSVDDLLLWHTCIRTRGQVYRKAVIAENVKEYDFPHTTATAFSKSPSKQLNNGFRAVGLEIYFVYKETSHSALLFLGKSLDENIFKTHHGWMHRSHYVNWNDRLCLEPNFGEDVAGLTAAIFDSKDKANTYKTIGIGDMTPIWNKKLQTKRLDPRIVRFPIRVVDSRYVAEVTTLALLASFRNGFGMQCDSSTVVDFIDYLEQIGLTRAEILSMQQSGSVVAVDGYTSRTSQGKEVFTTSVFFSATELKMLIRSLESLGKNKSENPRKDLQDALKNLASIYLGQINNVSDISVDDLMEAVTGIGKAMGKHPLGGINIKMITDPNKVPQRIIDDLIKKLTEDARRLREIENDKSCYFTFNGDRYYYILIDDMPLQGY